MAPIGTDFPIDVSLIDRVEVIRGPGSSLYGTSAFFAVVNVITKSGGSAPGSSARRVGGIAGDRRRATRALDGCSMAATSCWWRHRDIARAAMPRLYFPEFDVPGVSDGVVHRCVDDDSSAGLSASATLGRLSDQRRVRRSHQADSDRLLPDGLRRSAHTDGGCSRLCRCLLYRTLCRELDGRRSRRDRLLLVCRSVSVQRCRRDDRADRPAHIRSSCPASSRSIGARDSTCSRSEETSADRFTTINSRPTTTATCSTRAIRRACSVSTRRTRSRSSPGCCSMPACGWITTARSAPMSPLARDSCSCRGPGPL